MHPTAITIAIAVFTSVTIVTACFGLFALHGRGIILRTLRTVESTEVPSVDCGDQYLILLEALTYPKTYLLFKERARIGAAIDRLAAAPGFVPRTLPAGPSIWHRNVYFTG